MHRLSWIALAADVLRILEQHQKRRLIGVLLLSMTAACFTVIGIASITPFLAVLSDPSIVARNSVLAWLQQALGLTSDRALFTALGLGFVAIVCMANLINFLSLLAIGRFSQDVAASLHVRLFDEYIHRDLAFHKRTNSRHLEAQVVQEVNRAVDSVVRSGFLVLAGTLSVALITSIVFYFDAIVAVNVFGILGIAYVVVYRLVRRKLHLNGAVTTRFWRLRSRKISESFDAIRELTLLDALGTAVLDVATSSQVVARASASTAAIAACPKYLLECLVVIVLVAAAVQVYGGTNGDEWMTQLAFLSFAAYRLLPALQQVFGGAARIRADYGVFGAIVAVLTARQSESNAAPAGDIDPAWLGRPHRCIELYNVSYRHSSARTGGIEGVCVRIPAGSIVGLIGPSGSGKTTLAELMLGLIFPDEGQIVIDGMPLDMRSRRSWFATVAYVPQRITLSHGTISENIAFGVASDRIDHERLTEAIEGAQLGTLIAALPRGLETDIGEDGVQLSGGERQRVGIARALYRRASVLVLDEATNALDTESETQILKLVSRLRGECTTIIISHHARPISGCDLLLHLDNGRLTERKTHADEAAAIDVANAKHRAEA